MDIKVDTQKRVVVVRRGGVVVKNLTFDGKLIAGAGSNFLGNVRVKEAYFGKGCLINGIVEAEKVVIGASSRFNTVVCETALVLNKCRGKMIKAKGDVRIGNSNIGIVESEGTVFVDGSAKLGKLVASKVIAKSNDLHISEPEEKNLES